MGQAKQRGTFEERKGRAEALALSAYCRNQLKRHYNPERYRISGALLSVIAISAALGAGI